MTPDDLRALADALSSGTHYVESPELHETMMRAADYLRACADEKPVGYVTANGLRSLRQDDATVLLYAHDYLIRPDHVALYTHPAPAAPQAEPKREPLSDDAISYEHACRSSYESACAASDLDSFKLGVRFAERAHGISGGRHIGRQR